MTFRPVVRNPLLAAGGQKAANAGVFTPEASEIPKTASFPDVSSWGDDNGGNDSAHFGRVSGFRVDDAISGYVVQWHGIKGAAADTVIVRCAIYASDAKRAGLSLVPGSKASKTYSAGAGAFEYSYTDIIELSTPFHPPPGRPLFFMFNSSYDAATWGAGGVVPHGSPTTNAPGGVEVTGIAANLLWDMDAVDFDSDGFPVSFVPFSDLSSELNVMSMGAVPARLVLGRVGLPATSSTLIVAI